MVVNVLPLSAFAQAIETAGTNRAPVPSKAGTKGDRADTIEIEGVFSTIVGGATEQGNGDWVWTPTNTNPDHAFKFNVTYCSTSQGYRFKLAFMMTDYMWPTWVDFLRTGRRRI